jgi:hypothetical protein
MAESKTMATNQLFILISNQDLSGEVCLIKNGIYSGHFFVGLGDAGGDPKFCKACGRRHGAYGYKDCSGSPYRPSHVMQDLISGRKPAGDFWVVAERIWWSWE